MKALPFAPQISTVTAAAGRRNDLPGVRPASIPPQKAFRNKKMLRN